MANVKFDDITFRYGNHTVLEHFSLEVESGKIVCLVGPSGCGKTTLVRALLGLIKPETGSITVGDRVLFDAKKRVNVPAEKRNIGIVFQDYAVWPHMTVLENVCYPLKKQRRPKDEIKQRAMRALEQVHMTEYANHLPNQLSGGQQQRVAIARALVVDSDVLVMDEPITNLDAKLRAEMLLEIRMIQNRLGATILYITHDQQSALQLCDKMAIMEQDGTLCQYGTDEEIILRPANRFTFEFIGVSNFIPLAGRAAQRHRVRLLLPAESEGGFPGVPGQRIQLFPLSGQKADPRAAEHAGRPHQGRGRRGDHRGHPVFEHPLLSLQERS